MGAATRPRASRFLPALVTALAGPPAVCALALAWLRPDDAPIGLAAALLGAWVVLVALACRAGPRRARLVLALAPLALFTWPEMALRLAGFRRDHALTVQFGYPPPELLLRLRHDPELFWKLPLGHPDSNTHGFPGPEFTIQKAAGTYRMVFLGDSCAMQGYPARVADALRGGVAAPEAINFGVAGYSSHQGVVLARRWIEKLDADLVVVCFGWNDHWQAYGAPDSGKAAPAALRALRSAVQSTRVAQWLAGPAGEPARPLPVPRVSLAEYAANLETIGEIAQRAGAETLLLTAPSSHEVLGAPQMLVDEGFAADVAQIVELHRAYNDTVRDVARRRGLRLVDLAAEVPEDRVREIFTNDGIHYTDAGLAWVAERIAREVERLPRGQR